MLLLYVVCAGVALLVFALTFRIGRRRRIVIALVVFAVLSGAATLGISIVDDKPAPGDSPYNPR